MLTPRASSGPLWLPRLGAIVAAALAAGTLAVPASAVTPGPGLAIYAFAEPTNFSEAKNEACLNDAFACDKYNIDVTNVGSAPTNGSSITIADSLPAGVTMRQIRLIEIATGQNITGFCSQTPARVECHVGDSAVAEQHTLAPGEILRLEVWVSVNQPAGVLTSTATVSGGGAPQASSTVHTQVSSELASFGFANFADLITGVDGFPDTQAGDHPWELTTFLTLRSDGEGTPEGLRDVGVDLPLGFIGSAVAAPQCTPAQLTSPLECPRDTTIGHILTEPVAKSEADGPLFNMVPERGFAAQFGFRDVLKGTHFLYVSVVPTPQGYVVRTTSPEIPQLMLSNVEVSVFGDPAAHNKPVGPEPPGTETALFTNPSDCSSAPLVASAFMDSWEHPGAFNFDGTPDLSDLNWKSATAESPPVTGCDQLHFQPSSFSFAPEAAHSQADEPAGYESVLAIPQSEQPGALATPPLKTAVVTLPAGVSVSPSAANGLLGCQESGAEGINFESPAAGDCPGAANVGSVEVVTPLLGEPLTGSVFVAQPTCGGAGQPECSEALAEEGRLFAIYLEVGNEARGIHLKLKGKTEVGGNGTLSAREGKPLLAPGQVRTSFIETPQFPFSELKLKFNGGPRAPLANPQSCGTFTTNASFEPWSAPDSGPNALEQPTFSISGGCGGGFAPSFSAGTVANQAATFSAFTTTFSRHDSEQDLSGVTVNMPEGLLGKLAGIPQCPEAQANAGTCAAASKIGTATAAAGSGSDPLWQSGGVYLTGPYKGAPFGLSVVVPAVAGPYDLGLIVVRAAIDINPATAQATIVSDPLPQSVDGVPLRVQTVNVTVGEQGNFTFNPSSCAEKSIDATLVSAQGTSIPAASRFQAAGCQALPFHPLLTASTLGHTSKQDGAGLHVGIISAGIGQANIHKVELTIPNILPSRLTTLQKACREAQFNANPAGCPPESDIATAVVHTPLLNAPLTGPVYFVSHGGAAFPDTEIILQGEGVKLVLDGHTDIKHGITYSRFETVPDAPFTSFEFNAPEGPYSIFSANANLCQTEVRLPTTITAQNGEVIKQSTLVEPEGCPDTLTILSHTIKKRTIILKVSVPAAGKLTATGSQLTKTTKTAGGRGTITITLKANGHRKLKTKVKLTFTSAKGKRLTAAIAARFKP